MSRRADVITNSWLTEFTFEIMSNATKEQRKNLSTKQLIALRSPRKTKNYCTNVNIEERGIMFAKLGIPFFWVFGKIKKGFLTELYKIYKEDGAVKAIDLMLKERVFVVSDREILKILGLMSNNGHSQTYLLNRKYLQIGNLISKWRTDLELKVIQNDEIKDSIEAATNMAAVLYNHSLVLKTISDFGIKETAMIVLLFLFSKPKNYISELEIRNVFKDTHTHSQITYAFKSLVDNLYVEREVLKTVEFKITGLGIDTVMKYQSKVLNITFNY